MSILEQGGFDIVGWLNQVQFGGCYNPTRHSMVVYTNDGVLHKEVSMSDLVKIIDSGSRVWFIDVFSLVTGEKLKVIDLLSSSVKMVLGGSNDND